MKILLSTLLLMILVSSCSDVKDPVFEDVENFKLGKMNVSETTLAADLRFNNTNSFGFRLKKIDCKLYVDSSYLGHFTNAEPVRIPAKGNFILPLTGTAQTMTLMQQSGKAFSGKPSLVRAEGTARVGKSGFYKTIPVSFSDTLLLKF